MKIIESQFGKVRTTSINGVEYGSVYDSLQWLGMTKNTVTKLYSRLKKDIPEVTVKSKSFKFKGKGQRDTPVMTYDNLMILNNISQRFIDLDKNTRIKYVRKEYSFGESIINNFFSDYTIIPQYPVFNGEYYIDWYVPELNLAIEFDEEHHKHNIDKDRIRQKRIESELGCKFIRYTDH